MFYLNHARELAESEKDKRSQDILKNFSILTKVLKDNNIELWIEGCGCCGSPNISISTKQLDTESDTICFSTTKNDYFDFSYENGELHENK